jgi:hypothetical protein
VDERIEIRGRVPMGRIIRPLARLLRGLARRPALSEPDQNRVLRYDPPAPFPRYWRDGLTARGRHLLAVLLQGGDLAADALAGAGPTRCG